MTVSYHRLLNMWCMANPLYYCALPEFKQGKAWNSTTQVMVLKIIVNSQYARHPYDNLVVSFLENETREDVCKRYLNEFIVSHNTQIVSYCQRQRYNNQLDYIFTSFDQMELKLTELLDGII